MLLLALNFTAVRGPAARRIFGLFSFQNRALEKGGHFPAHLGAPPRRRTRRANVGRKF